MPWYFKDQDVSSLSVNVYVFMRSFIKAQSLVKFSYRLSLVVTCVSLWSFEKNQFKVIFSYSRGLRGHIML
jgi:hypothetical protein